MTSLIRYRAIYERNLTFLKTQATPNGPAHGPSLMNIVMELRKCCNHPFLIEGAEAQILRQTGVVPGGSVGDVLVSSAGKMVLVNKLLPKLRKQGRKVLIFSQARWLPDFTDGSLISQQVRWLPDFTDGSLISQQVRWLHDDI